MNANGPVIVKFVSQFADRVDERPVVALRHHVDRPADGVLLPAGIMNEWSISPASPRSGSATCRHCARNTSSSASMPKPTVPSLTIAEGLSPPAKFPEGSSNLLPCSQTCGSAMPSSARP